MKMNNKTWAIIAVVGLVVVGGAWAVSGGMVGNTDTLPAAAAKPSTKPPAGGGVPGGAPSGKPTNDTYVPPDEGICGKAKIKTACEIGKVNDAISSCKKSKGECGQVVLEYDSSGELVGVTMKKSKK